MIGGFALVAYPAEYGNSGVMTFWSITTAPSIRRISARAAVSSPARMTSFNPDQTWKRVDAAELE